MRRLVCLDQLTRTPVLYMLKEAKSVPSSVPALERAKVASGFLFLNSGVMFLPGLCPSCHT